MKGILPAIVMEEPKKKKGKYSNCKKEIRFIVFCRNHAGDMLFNPPGKPSDTNPQRWTKKIKWRLEFYQNWLCQVREVFRTELIAGHWLNRNLVPFSIDEYGKIEYNKKQKCKEPKL